jgi:hypothetical protein
MHQVRRKCKRPRQSGSRRCQKAFRSAQMLGDYASGVEKLRMAKSCMVTCAGIERRGASQDAGVRDRSGVLGELQIDRDLKIERKWI